MLAYAGTVLLVFGAPVVILVAIGCGWIVVAYNKLQLTGTARTLAIAATVAAVLHSAVVAVLLWPQI